MSLYLGDYRTQINEAVKAFWGNRAAAQKKQIEAGKTDAGTRGAVTAGKNLDGFRALIVDLVRGNGLTNARIFTNKGHVVLPGFFRPTKQWDVLVFNGGTLVAAFEFKSQIGSLGNNCNNRSEEAVGTAQCFRTAHREHPVLRSQPKPFLGWLIVVEDSAESRSPVGYTEPHFKIFPEFKRDTSYLGRYDALCDRLVKEDLYHVAALIATPHTAADTGEYTEVSPLSGMKLFVTKFAAHIAAEAALGPTFK